MMIRNRNQAQMIALMGIMLAVSVFMISSLAAEIANIEFIVTTQEDITLSAEFASVKETFCAALNYNLIDVYINTTDSNRMDESYYEGDINDLETAFNQTRQEYFNMYLRRGIVFDAKLDRSWFSKEETIQLNNTVFYSVKLTLYLDDGDSCIAEDVTYLIACSPKTV